MLKAVIFDMDGVLLDSESIHYEILRDMMARRGFSYTTEHLHRYCGVPEEQMWPQLLREAGLLRESPLALRREHWERYEWRIRSEGLPKFPGTKELLESLRDAGYRLAVASASPMALILRNLRALRLDGAFDKIASAQECGGRGKPEPDVFLLAAEKLETAPEDCLVVEDSANGMTAAYRAGMKWVGFDGARVKPDMRRAIFAFSDYRTVSPERFRHWYEHFPSSGELERKFGGIAAKEGIL